jgi:hypothetical protein
MRALNFSLSIHRLLSYAYIEVLKLGKGQGKISPETGDVFLTTFSKF